MNTVREPALRVDWEKNPLPHLGIKPALPTELHLHPMASKRFSVFTHTHTLTHTQTHTYTVRQTDTHIHTHIHTHIQTHTYRHTHSHTHTHMHAHSQSHTYTPPADDRDRDGCER